MDSTASENGLKITSHSVVSSSPELTPPPGSSRVPPHHHHPSQSSATGTPEPSEPPPSMHQCIHSPIQEGTEKSQLLHCGRNRGGGGNRSMFLGPAYKPSNSLAWGPEAYGCQRGSLLVNTSRSLSSQRVSLSGQIYTLKCHYPKRRSHVDNWGVGGWFMSLEIFKSSYFLKLGLAGPPPER